MAEFRTEITAERKQYDATMDAAAQKALTTGQAIASAMRDASLQMSQAIHSANETMNKSFDAVKATVEKVRGAIAAVGAVVGGSGIFGKLIQDTAKMTSEAVGLSKILGITTQEATALRIALGDIGVQTDDYTSMVQKMTMKLREGEERFNELGVKTRGANGELLNTEQITQNALTALQGFKAGTDRNLAATELFGKGWGEVMKLLRLTPAAMEAARVKAEELQMTVGPEGAERTKQYKLALNEVKDVGEALANRVGQALMPVLTDFGNWIGSIGPGLVIGFRGAIGGLVAVFYGLKMAVEIVWEGIKLFFKSIGAVATAAADILMAVERRDWAGIKAAWKTGAESIGASFEEGMKNVMDKAQANRARLMALFDPAAEQGTGAKTDTGGRTYTGKTAPTADKSRMQQWEAELAAQRDAYDKQKLEQGSFEQFTRQMERDYWKALLSQQDLSVAERSAISKKYYDAEREIRKQAFEAEIADIKGQIEAHRKGSVERIQIAGEMAAKIGQRYGLESKEYRAALAEMHKLAVERAEQQRSLDELALDANRQYQISRLDLERENLETLEKLGLMKAQEKLAFLKDLKNLEFAIEIKAAEEKAQLLENDALAYQQQLNRIEAMKQKHALDMVKIDGQIALEQKKSLDSWLDPVGQAVQTMANGVLQGTQTMSQMFMNALRGMASQYIAVLVKMGVDWVKTEILKTQATAAGAAARTAAETSASGTSMIMTAGSAIKNIGAKAWEAAANVYAAISQIPVVGPFLAPAMAIAAAAMVIGFVSRIASAAGGYDIPAGMNPMTQLHGEEMVLPKDIANPLREQLADGGGGISGGEMHLHVHALDSKDFNRYVMDNRRSLGAALRKLARES